jgi:triacylglycerol lipase
VLAAGAFGPELAYEPLADRLRRRGYDVHIFVIANPLQSMVKSTPALADFVDHVLATTGAKRVDMITHSQSGLLARYYTRYLGGADKIGTLISMSGLQYGSALANVPALLGIEDCIGVDVCVELAEGSAFIRSLTEPNDTDGKIRYVNFASKSDVLAIPYTNNHLYGTGDITNVTIQVQCPWRFVGHLGYILDGTVASGLYDALAGREITLDCYAL